jgi:hypothetical protein
MNEIVLGCHLVDTGRDLLYPMTLDARRRAYLLKGLPSLTGEVIERIGFAERAETHGLLNRLKSADIMPHGGGYRLFGLARLNRVLGAGDDRCFECTRAGEDGIERVCDVRDIPYDYRGEEVLNKTLTLGLGELAFVLDPMVPESRRDHGIG